MKTTSTGSVKTLRIIARVISTIIVGFALFMFILESLEGAKRANPEPNHVHNCTMYNWFCLASDFSA